jgi:DNA-binding LytR/AlgR family response regulator
MGEVLGALAKDALVRIHRNHAVNAGRVREIRRRTPGGDWEVKLEPPVNRVLPVSRNASKRLPPGKPRSQSVIPGGPC